MNYVKRFVITHKDDREGYRRLTFAQQGRHTFPTKNDANEVLELLLGPSGLGRVLSQTEVRTLRVDAVDCYQGHFDPVRYFADD